MEGNSQTATLEVPVLNGMMAYALVIFLFLGFRMEKPITKKRQLSYRVSNGYLCINLTQLPKGVEPIRKVYTLLLQPVKDVEYLANTLSLMASTNKLETLFVLKESNNPAKQTALYFPDVFHGFGILLVRGNPEEETEV